MRDVPHPLDLASAYDAGRIGSPLRLLIDTRVALDAQAALDRREADALGGALLEAIAPTALRPDALAQVLSELDAVDREAPAAKVVRAARGAVSALDELLALPEPVRGLALERFGTGWRFAGPGVKTLYLVTEGAAKAQLIRIDAGRGVPVHGHAGGELTLVLNGAFSVAGATYRQGDLCVADADVVHQPIAEPGDTCIVLAVTDAPLEFKGALGLIQKVFRLN